jgi:hypothetical protein
VVTLLFLICSHAQVSIYLLCPSSFPFFYFFFLYFLLSSFLPFLSFSFPLPLFSFPISFMLLSDQKITVVQTAQSTGDTLTSKPQIAWQVDNFTSSVSLVVKSVSLFSLFSSSILPYLLILPSSHLPIFPSSHLPIFPSSHLPIFPLYLPSSSSLFIFPLHLPSSSSLLIFPPHLPTSSASPPSPPSSLLFLLPPLSLTSPPSPIFLTIKL